MTKNIIIVVLLACVVASIFTEFNPPQHDIFIVNIKRTPEIMDSGISISSNKITLLNSFAMTLHFNKKEKVKPKYKIYTAQTDAIENSPFDILINLYDHYLIQKKGEYRFVWGDGGEPAYEYTFFHGMTELDIKRHNNDNQK